MSSYENSMVKIFPDDLGHAALLCCAPEFLLTIEQVNSVVISSAVMKSSDKVMVIILSVLIISLETSNVITRSDFNKMKGTVALY